jgi:hypothetical protein
VFASRYFAPRYFPPRYWPAGGSATPGAGDEGGAADEPVGGEFWIGQRRLSREAGVQALASRDRATPPVIMPIWGVYSRPSLAKDPRQQLGSEVAKRRSFVPRRPLSDN